MSKFIDLRQVGGVADSAGPGNGTDNYPAFQAAFAELGRGGVLRIPDGGDYFFRSSQMLFRPAGISIIGDGWHENPGIVNGVSYPIPRNYSGSVVCFDSDVPGVDFSAFTDHNANSVAYQYHGSSHSVCRDVMFLGGGGTGTDSHGVSIYDPVVFQNVRIRGFAGNGININANTAGALRYGNADLSQFYGVISEANSLHGIYLDGNDANVITVLGCNFNNNGGCGSLDTTPVGNQSFIANHYSVNNRSFGTPAGVSAAQRSKVVADAPCLSDQYTGSAIQYRLKDYSGSDIGNESIYLCNYVESGTGSKARLRSPTKADRGFLSEPGFWHSEFNAQIDTSGSLYNYNNLIGAAGILKVSGDTIAITSRDQADTYATISPTGIDIDTGGGLSIGGNGVVGARQPGIANDVSGAANQATVNALLNALRAHGLIG